VRERENREEGRQVIKGAEEGRKEGSRGMKGKKERKGRKGRD
jgi:hypothetical protein